MLEIGQAMSDINERDTTVNDQLNENESIEAQAQREVEDALDGASMEDLMSSVPDPAPADPSAGSKAQPATATEPTAKMEIRRGRITQVAGDDVFVELAGVDGKNQGVVPLTQFERAPRPGSIMDFVVNTFDKAEGLYILSREGVVGKTTWDHLYKGANVEARVTATNKGGLELELVGSIKAFMPASQIDLHHVDDLESLVGQKLKASVQEIDKKNHRVLLSRKQFLLNEREALAKKLWNELEENQDREATISRIVEYGAFADLGGVDGLIHISDLSYGHIAKVSDVLKEGEKVTVRVLKLDAESKKVRLGLKQVAPDPWEGIEGRIKHGDDVTARVLRLVDFGAFVEVESGVEALLPISELSWKRIHKPNEVLSDGQVLRVKVIQLEADKRKLAVSLKQAQGDPWVGAEHKWPAKSLVEATVTRTTEFGAFVEIETGVEGLCHISELSDRRVNVVTDVLKEGDRKTFRVLETDEEQRRIKLSIKAVAEKVEEPAPQREARPDHRKAPAPGRQHAARKRDANLKGGMGSSGALGMGLGDLKL
ncbi:MAG: S1 RNA-binding domain-containing protein [Phycisphaera sp.]|nr:S1 RNA-binding domain-containing protein [Phycisphaera sp.]